MSDRVNELAQGLTGLRVIDILKWPGVVKGAEVDLDKLEVELFASLSDALNDLVEVRKNEGTRLTQMIVARLQELTEKNSGG